MTPKGVAFLITGIILVPAAFVVIGKIYFMRACQLAFTADAVQVICYAVHEMLQKKGNVNDVDINERIKYLFDASVINIRLKKDGEPVDAYGNPFQLTHKAEQGKTIVTRISLGPDGRQGTSDDILYVYDGT